MKRHPRNLGHGVVGKLDVAGCLVRVAAAHDIENSRAGFPGRNLAATVGRIEVISFDEPEEYIPRSVWYEQFDGESLDDDLRLARGIDGVTGATLTARATTNAVRRVLAVHQALEESSP